MKNPRFYLYLDVFDAELCIEMYKIIIKNKLIFFLYFCFLLSALTFLISKGKINSHLLLNNFHTSFFDYFFRILTYLGDGLFMVITGLFLILFISIRYGLIILSSFLASSLIVQLLKRFIFAAYDRPVLFFQNLGMEIYKIPGLEYHGHFSFPSGHSTSAFALFIGLAIFSKRDSLKIIFLLAACLTAFSRVYLSQHFLEDIIAGSILGTITSIIVYFLFTRWENPRVDSSLVKYKQYTNE
jgi:membrane-associated phospholipid phosphatase